MGTGLCVLPASRARMPPSAWPSLRAVTAPQHGASQRGPGRTQTHRTAVPGTHSVPKTQQMQTSVRVNGRCAYFKEFTRQETTLKTKKANNTFKGRNLEIVQINSGANQFLKKLCITAITFIGKVGEK